MSLATLNCVAPRVRCAPLCRAPFTTTTRNHPQRVLNRLAARRTSASPRSLAQPARIVCQQAGAVPSSPLSALASSKKFDRIRSQAKVVFDHYDQDKDGFLSATDLDTYIKVVEARPLGLVADAVKSTFTQLTAGNGPAATYDFEQFEAVYRQQVDVVQQYARTYLAGSFTGGEIEKTKFDFTLKDEELAAAHWAFKSMDFEGTGVIPAERLERAPGIEGEIVQGKVLEEIEGPSIAFTDYLRSYANPKPVFLNMAILLAHTAVMYFILQLPIDLMLKGVLVAVVFIRPQLITNAVIHVYNIGLAIVNNIRANMEMNQNGSSRLV